MNIIDIIIYIRDRLDESEREGLASMLASQSGVMSSKFHTKKQQILMLTYNPGKTSSGHLLNKIVTSGLDARLVGL